MGLSEERIEKLEGLCRQFRKDVLTILHEVQTGHAGGSLSECEILTLLYLECANISKENQNQEDRDRIVLSKGHGAPMLYRCLAEKGFFPKEELHTLRQPGSRLQGHPCSAKTPGVELSTGPLGIGLSASVGMACANRLRGNDAYVYTVLGDGELNEGTVWEAAMSAAKFRCSWTGKQRKLCPWTAWRSAGRPSAGMYGGVMVTAYRNSMRLSRRQKTRKTGSPASFLQIP